MQYEKTKLNLPYNVSALEHILFLISLSNLSDCPSVDKKYEGVIDHVGMYFHRSTDRPVNLVIWALNQLKKMDDSSAYGYAGILVASLSAAEIEFLAYMAVIGRPSPEIRILGNKYNIFGYLPGNFFQRDLPKIHITARIDALCLDLAHCL